MTVKGPIGLPIISLSLSLTLPLSLVEHYLGEHSSCEFQTAGLTQHRLYIQTERFFLFSVFSSVLIITALNHDVNFPHSQLSLLSQ
jgi:hypothetical protein